jgi:hypothetical protein
MILSSLATSQQAATSLVNALQHVNREKESVADNERVQRYLAQVKTERKKIVRYGECALCCARLSNRSRQAYSAACARRGVPWRPHLGQRPDHPVAAAVRQGA